MKDDIDFVVLWVDGNDENWRKTKEKWEKENNIYNEANGEERYRDWEQFHYWFRAVEKFAPWVRNIYLVTCGQVPKWLNINHPKLRLIKHEDYMDEDCLPTFNSSAIEMNFHKIEGLGEYFVYFNDDMILTNEVRPEDFFSGGKPLTCAAGFPVRNNPSNSVWWHCQFTILGLTNKYNWENIIKKSPEKWFNYKYGKLLKYNWRMCRDAYLAGFYYVHFASPLRKSTLKKTYEEFEKEVNETSHNRFRNPNDLTQQIFKIHDIANGDFIPCSPYYFGVYYDVCKNLDDLVNAIKSQKHMMVCINDSPEITNDNFEQIRDCINDAFKTILPEKSSFEL